MPGPGVLVLARLPSVREGFRTLLDGEGCIPVHTARSAAEALPQVLILRPDVPWWTAVWRTAPE
jgi:hypothetical protein